MDTVFTETVVSLLGSIDDIIVVIEVIVVLFADGRLVVVTSGVKGEVELKVDGLMVGFVVVGVVVIADVGDAFVVVFVVVDVGDVVLVVVVDVVVTFTVAFVVVCAEASVLVVDGVQL